MEGGVKFIFKTLLKVPIIILVSFAVFNVFAFSLSYFKILGISYVAMQTAVENNYIPKDEWNTLNSYLGTLQTEMLDQILLECSTDSGTNSGFYSGENRVQYGNKVKVTVSAHYRFVWPLQQAEQVDNGTAADDARYAAAGESGQNVVAGYNKQDGSSGDTTMGFASDDILEARREAYEERPNNIVISYTVPGLKYYPDMS